MTALELKAILFDYIRTNYEWLFNCSSTQAEQIDLAPRSLNQIQGAFDILDHLIENVTTVEKEGKNNEHG